ncbi:M23 family metallopeptidase [Mycetocola zhadangensis]|uniref:M23 family metallopeptidase n=1 Tax=Mycetocola zhadangensis TaxID=1164595 RepID=A0A3L7J6M0_9MICO|nr:M23 family metallopeptidase [Mycetocola zhadangensis]RLQ86358.1 M23 family metallopeptidase [Mycetocola zhadangensis]GGE90537.1 peptidase [Mycetocola zhadangensis]
MTAAQPNEPGRRLVLDLPFTGRWLVQNSPARRVPSHGTDAFGERYAIDFVGVDARRRTTEHVSLRTLAGAEPPELFFSFGRPILAPCDGVIAEVHDGEPDHEARRSPFALVGYMLGQGGRMRQGVSAIAGNYVIIELPDRGAFVALVHLQRDSLIVGAGDRVVTGQRVAVCGNSGNSTQPHVHVQAMDSRDLSVAQGIPIVFRRYREELGSRSLGTWRESSVPAEGAVVEP